MDIRMAVYSTWESRDTRVLVAVDGDVSRVRTDKGRGTIVDKWWLKQCLRICGEEMRHSTDRWRDEEIRSIHSLDLCGFVERVSVSSLYWCAGEDYSNRWCGVCIGEEQHFNTCVGMAQSRKCCVLVDGTLYRAYETDSTRVAAHDVGEVWESMGHTGVEIAVLGVAHTLGFKCGLEGLIGWRVERESDWRSLERCNCILVDDDFIGRCDVDL
ncbi:hypothetical protein Tco_0851315 [Tanacetum coccineum]